MAAAMMVEATSDLKSLTDCIFFINGECRLENVCPFRHCRDAVKQPETCIRWPDSCRDRTCRYRHPLTLVKAPKRKGSPVTAATVNPPPQPLPPTVASTEQQGVVGFFWDIENVPIPRDQMPFDIVQRIRQKLVTEPDLREESFSCYCKASSIPERKQLSLQDANVRIIHVPARKPGAVDIQILIDLDRFARCHRPPATVVLISGDIDFVNKLSDLRHQARYNVIVIHNRPAKEELKATANACYPWDLFTQQNVPQFNMNSTANAFDMPRAPRPWESSDTRHASRSRNHYRRNSSPPRSLVDLPKQQPVPISCPKCGDEFDTLPALRQHQTAKNHLFACPTCNEHLVTQAALAQHQRDKGHYVQEYKCDQCNRRFAKMEHLEQHRQTVGHTAVTANPPNQLNRLAPAHTASSLIAQPNDEKDPIDIILEGIEVISDYYRKRFARTN